MTAYEDLQDTFERQDFKLIIVADAETRVSAYERGKPVLKTPAGGVAVALNPVAKAAQAIYIARGKTEEEKKISANGKIPIEDPNGRYQLRRLFFTKEEIDAYYYGFSNQTLWPLCHVTFERPEFNREWYEGFKSVNQKFAQAVKEEIGKIRGKTFLWVNDYQLCLVPHFLGKPKDTILAMFWHIPWPTWEVYRILPFKREILESLLLCDFLAFHRGYHVRNFLETVERELETRIDDERNKVYYNKTTTLVKNLPMGVDVDVIASLIEEEEQDTVVGKIMKRFLTTTKKENGVGKFFAEGKIILGVDRLDYTKGLLLRFDALDRFFSKYPKYLSHITYVGIIAPSRMAIRSYQNLKRQVKSRAAEINKKYAKHGWEPIHLRFKVYPREDIIHFYQRAAVCLVTPRDDGMNLVSKEFVVAASFAQNPGVLILSTFAGSAIDLTDALIVNPYDTEAVTDAMKRALEMSKKEKQERIKTMAQTLEDRNVYEWAKQFIESAVEAKRENKREE